MEHAGWVASASPWSPPDSVVLLAEGVFFELFLRAFERFKVKVLDLIRSKYLTYFVRLAFASAGLLRVRGIFAAESGHDFDRRSSLPSLLVEVESFVGGVEDILRQLARLVLLEAH